MLIQKKSTSEQPSTLKTNNPVRVLVVDDSALMRKLISEMINQAEGLVCIGTARDGEAAIASLKDLQPDVITLDVEMPKMNGIQFLEAMMLIRPTPVVMVSSLTAEGAEITMACLQRGAIDFVTKPSGSISVDIAKRSFEIVQKIREAANSHVRIPRALLQNIRNGTSSEQSQTSLNTSLGSAPPNKNIIKQDLVSQNRDVQPGARSDESSVQTRKIQTISPHSEKILRPIDNQTVLVAIASSTGGPAALNELMPHLPADLNAVYLLVQHLPVGFTKSLSDRLDSQCSLTVREAAENDILKAGLALMAPGGKHLMLNNQSRIVLNSDPPLWGVRPAADVMMQSVQAHFNSRVIGVVLTGMGRDGALGARSIHSRGGWCLAQNEASCVVYGMPRAAVEAGAIDQVVSLQEMAAVIIERVKILSQRQSGRNAA